MRLLIALGLLAVSATVVIVVSAIGFMLVAVMDARRGKHL